MEEKQVPQEQKQELTVQQAANEVYNYLRKMQISADEHDALKHRMSFLLGHAEKAITLEKELNDAQVTIKSLESKKKK